jgi:hypothetical protein
MLTPKIPFEAKTFTGMCSPIYDGARSRRFNKLSSIVELVRVADV